MKAKSREQFVAAWTSHVKELVHVFLDAQEDISDWENMKDELLRVVESAADATFGIEVQTDFVCGACTVALGGHTMKQGCREYEGEQS